MDHRDYSHIAFLNLCCQRRKMEPWMKILSLESPWRTGSASAETHLPPWALHTGWSIFGLLLLWTRTWKMLITEDAAACKQSRWTQIHLQHRAERHEARWRSAALRFMDHGAGFGSHTDSCSWWRKPSPAGQVSSGDGLWITAVMNVDNMLQLIESVCNEHHLSLCSLQSRTPVSLWRNLCFTDVLPGLWTRGMKSCVCS